MATLGSAFIEILPLPGFSAALQKEVSEAADAAEKTADEGASGFSKVSTMATAAIGAAAVAVAAYSIDAATKFEASQTQMANAAGITTQQANAIGDAFLDTAFKSTFSAQQMVTAYAGVAGQFTALNGQALSTADTVKVMAAATDLAEASGTNLGASTSALAGVMVTYKLGVGDAASATDDLYNVSKATGSPVDTLATGIDKLHAKLGDLAPSLGDTSTLLVELAEQGLTGSRGMLVLNTALQTLISPSAKVQGVLQALGINVFNMSGQFVGMQSVISQLNPVLAKMSDQQQDAALKTLFGASASQSMLAIIEGGLPAWQRASDAVTKHGTAQAAAAANAATFEGHIKTLQAAGEDLAVEIGRDLIPVLDTLMTWLTDGINLVENNRAVQVALAGALVAVVAPAIVGMVASIGAWIAAEATAVATSAAHAAAVIAGWLGIGSASTAGAVAAATATETIEAGDAAKAASAAAVAAAETASTAQMVADYAEQVAAQTGTIEAANALATAQAAAATTAATAVEASSQAIVASYAEEVASAEGAEAATAAFGGSLTAALGPLGLVAAGVAAFAHVIDASQTSVKAASDAYAGQFVQSTKSAGDQIQVLQDKVNQLTAANKQLMTDGNPTGATYDTAAAVVEASGAYRTNAEEAKQLTSQITALKAQQSAQKDATDAVTKSMTDTQSATAAYLASLAAQTPAWMSASNAAAVDSSETSKLADATKAANDAASAATTQINSLKTALDDLIGVHVTMATANANFAQDILDDTTKVATLKTGIDKHTGAINLNTQAGIDLSNQLSKNVTDIIATGKATLDSTGNTQLATTAIDNNVTAFDNQLKKLGLTPAAIAAVNTQYGLIPSVIATTLEGTVDINTTDAIAAIGALNKLGGVLFSTDNKTVVGPHAVAASGALTKGPTLAGEGRYPEYVIPTDPQYNANALALTRHLVNRLPGLAAGGIAGGAIAGFGSAFDTAGLDAVTSTQDILDAQAQAAVNRITAEARQAVAAQQAASASVGGVATPGEVVSWITTAMSLTGVPASWLPGLELIAHYESGDNPSAINLTDSNARAGHPSQGLFQTIPGTFAAYALPGYNKNIDDPVSNTAAAIRYIEARYGTISNVPGVRSVAHGGAYVGYDAGGWLMPGVPGLNTTGSPELVLTPDQSRTYAGGGAVEVSLVIAPVFNYPIDGSDATEQMRLMIDREVTGQVQTLANLIAARRT